ncbi:glutathione S-transferase [Rhodobacterales bacterium HKCCE2091]|nr:glutathione S-transferase [Rhodobacterales bacterium HKCCE2091]
MKLHWSPRSPFVRKVMIVLHEKGLVDRVELVRSVVVLAAPANPDVLVDNPLGKIPALVPDEGPALFDSRVICEYLDGIAPEPAMIPADFDGRIRCLRWQALADGLTDILVLWRNEVAGGDYANPKICGSYETKALATVARLDAEVPDLAATPFGLGHAAAVCALGQLDFRYGGSGWREAHPALARWYDEMGSRPSVAATAIEDDGAAIMGDVEMPLRFGRAS